SADGRRTRSGAGARELPAAAAGAAACAQSGCSGTLAAGPREAMVSVSCGSGVIIPQSATCTATVADTGAGTPSTPTGTVSLSSDAAGASFGLSGTCTLSALDSGTKSGRSAEYTPGHVRLVRNTIPPAY